MNTALLRKTARDALLLFVLTAAGVLLFEILFVLVISSVSVELFETLAENLPLIRNLILALANIDIAGGVAVSSMAAFGLGHPFVFVFCFGFLITVCTRATVGEIDRGTADLLLTLPISRTAIFGHATAVWAAGAAVLSVSAWSGVTLGAWLFEVQGLSAGLLAPAAVNLFALLLAVGCSTMLVSSLVDRRGVAVGWIIGLLLFSLILNFVAAFISAAKPLSALGFLHYYRPVDVVRLRVWPIGNIAVLLGAAIACWIGGWWRFRTRDVPAT